MMQSRRWQALPAAAAGAEGAASDGLLDIQPPVPIAPAWHWLGWIIGIVALVAAIGLLVWYWRHSRRKAHFTPPPSLSPYQTALRDLRDVFGLIEDPKDFCFAISNILRQYLDGEFQMRACERTTEEFLPELQAAEMLTPTHKEQLQRMLTQCDLAKFAAYKPSVEELRRLYNEALTWVDETYRTKQALMEEKEDDSAPQEPVVMAQDAS